MNSYISLLAHSNIPSTVCFKWIVQNRTEQFRKLGKLQSYYLDEFNLKGVFIRHQQVMRSSIAVKTAEQGRAPSRSVSSWELFNCR